MGNRYNPWPTPFLVPQSLAGLVFGMYHSPFFFSSNLSNDVSPFPFLFLQIVPFAYLVGLSLIPRQFYQERQNIVPGGDKTAYVVLPDGADSPLLDEDRQDHEVYEARGGQFKNSQLSLQTIKVEAAGK